MSLLPQDSLCHAQEFLLGLYLMTDFYDSTVYNFDTWDQALRTALDLASEELK